MIDNQNIDNIKSLELLWEVLGDDILQTSSLDLMDEVAEDYGDATILAQQFRDTARGAIDGVNSTESPINIEIIRYFILIKAYFLRVILNPISRLMNKNYIALPIGGLVIAVFSCAVTYKYTSINYQIAKNITLRVPVDNQDDMLSARSRIYVDSQRASGSYLVADYPGALESLTDAIHNSQNYGAINPFIVAELLNDRAIVYATIGDEKSAIKDLSDALKSDPSFSLALNNYGLIKVKTDVSSAIELFSAAIERDKSPMLYKNRGVAFMLQGKLKLASSDFDAALKIQSSFPQAILGRALVRDTIGKSPAVLEKEVQKILSELRDKAVSDGHLFPGLKISPDVIAYLSEKSFCGTHLALMPGYCSDPNPSPVTASMPREH